MASKYIIYLFLQYPGDIYDVAHNDNPDLSNLYNWVFCITEDGMPVFPTGRKVLHPVVHHFVSQKMYLAQGDDVIWAYRWRHKQSNVIYGGSMRAVSVFWHKFSVF